MTHPSLADDLTAALDALGDLIVRRDAAGRVAYVNAAFLRTFGGSRDDWEGRWFAILADEPAPAAAGRRRRESKTETVAGPAWIEWEETRLTDGGVIAVGRDVSARRAGEEALRDARAFAEAAARAKETVFAAVTHELRTPLNGVLGMADLLTKTSLTAEQRAYVDAVGDSGRHLLALVDDVLDAAKLEAGVFKFALADVDPAALVQEAAELVAPRARAKGLEVVVRLDPSAPRRVRADAARVRQILLNLAGNAVKFTDTGAVLMTLDCEEVAHGAATLAFRVRDTGPGVPEAERTRIFDAFARAAANAQAAEGAGLGLAIVSRLVDAMGGAVGLQTPPDGGAEFWARAHFTVVEPAPAGVSPLAGRAVLVAGPRRLAREAVVDQLRLLGARAEPAADLDALAAALADDPDQVVLVEEAWAEAAAATAVRARAALVLAAPDERAALAERLAAGYAGWIVKPCRPASLIRQLERAWTGASAADGEEGAPDRPPVARPAAGHAPGPDAARVLLVEDNPVNRLLSETLLGRLGCRVDVAEAGDTAVEAAAETPYDLILMDLRLPRLDGLEATRRLRADGGASADAPVVALTANTSQADRDACREAGMDDFLTKPVDEEGLAAALARWTNPPRQRMVNE